MEKKNVMKEQEKYEVMYVSNRWINDRESFSPEISCVDGPLCGVRYKRDFIKCFKSAEELIKYFRFNESYATPDTIIKVKAFGDMTKGGNGAYYVNEIEIINNESDSGIDGAMTSAIGAYDAIEERLGIPENDFSGVDKTYDELNIGRENKGYGNIGYRNSGAHNVGNYNYGVKNYGYYNGGEGNHGFWNIAYGSYGCFNSKEQTIRLFNKDSDWTMSDWYHSEAYELMCNIGGVSSHTALEWWNSLCGYEKSIIMSIPNFDKEVFKEVVGIDIDNNTNIVRQHSGASMTVPYYPTPVDNWDGNSDADLDKVTLEIGIACL
jgi:hypothetical protein